MCTGGTHPGRKRGGHAGAGWGRTSLPAPREPGGQSSLSDGKEGRGGHSPAKACHSSSNPTSFLKPAPHLSTVPPPSPETKGKLLFMPQRSPYCICMRPFLHVVHLYLYFSWLLDQNCTVCNFKKICTPSPPCQVVQGVPHICSRGNHQSLQL